MRANGICAPSQRDSLRVNISVSPAAFRQEGRNESFDQYNDSVFTLINQSKMVPICEV